MRWTMLVGGLALGCAGADERAKDSGDGADASCETGLTAVLVVSELGFTVPDESGNVAGFDLDGITSTDGDPAGCGHGDAVSPDGETGVDSAFAGLAPLLEGLGAGAVAGLVQGAVDSGELLILVELTGLDGPLSPDLNDDCVTFTLHRGAGAPILGTDGRILVDQTFGKDTTYPSSGTVQGRIEEGHFRADNVDLSLPVQILDEFLVFNVASASFAFDMLEDGDVQGFFAGGVPVDELAGQIAAIDDLGGLQDVIPPLLESTADLFPDDNGECVELSIGFDMTGRPAFLLDEG